MKTEIAFEDIVGSAGAAWEVKTSAAGPAGRLPLTAEMLLERPSGDIFGLTQNAGMGWDPSQLGRPQFLMLSVELGYEILFQEIERAEAARLLDIPHFHIA